MAYIRYSRSEWKWSQERKIPRFAWLPTHVYVENEEDRIWRCVDGAGFYDEAYRWVWGKKYVAVQGLVLIGHYQYGGYYGEESVFRWRTVKKLYIPEVAQLPSARLVKR